MRVALPNYGHLMSSQKVNMNNGNFASRFIRLGGIVALFAGGLMALADIWHATAGLLVVNYSGSSTEELGSIIFLVGRVLVVLALPGLYLYQSESAGKFGLIAFAIVMLGNTLMVSSDWSEVFIGPILRRLDPTLFDQPPTRLMVGFLINFIIETLGWLLFGISVYRARVFPRPAAILLILGVLLPFVGPSWSYVVMYAVIVWMGLIIARNKQEESTQLT